MIDRDEVARALDGLAVPPGREGQSVREAHAALLAGRPGQSIEALHAAESALATWLLGLAHLQQRDPYRAAAALERAVEAEPALIRARYLLACVYELQDDFERATDELRRVLERRPDHVDAIAALARCYVRLDRVERAEALARRGLELAPRSVPLLHALADGLRYQGRHAEAVEVLRRALPHAADDDSLRIALARSLLALGQADEARPLFEEVLRRDAESIDALAGMAQALEAGGRFGEALGYVLRALAGAPDRARLHLLHARISLRGGRLDVAESAAGTAATLEPDHEEALRIGLRAAQAQRRHGEAARFADRLLSRRAEDPEALAATAIALVLRGRATDALTRLEPALERGGTPELWFAEGCALICLGRAAEAADRFIEVVRARADDDLAQRLLGVAYRCASDPRAPGTPAVRRLLTGDDPDDDDDDDSTAINEPAPAPAEGPSSEQPRPQRLTGPIAPMVEVAVNALIGDTRPSPPAGWERSAAPRPPSSGAASEPPPPAQEPEPSSSITELPSAERRLGRLSSPSGDRPPPEVLARLRRLRAILASEPGSSDLLARLDHLQESHDRPLMLAVLGPRGAGKTTFVNALIGQETIPADTRVPHLLRYGRRPGGRVVYHDGHVEVLRFQDLRAHLAGTRLDPAQVRLVEILVPVEELTRASILDVPEPEAIDAEEDSLLGDADAVLWLVGADQPAEAWEAAVARLTLDVPAAIAVLTRTDLVEPATLDRRIAEVEARLAGRADAVVALSARRGLDALRSRDVGELRQSGFTRLHRELRRCFFSRVGGIRGEALARSCERIRAEALRRVEARARRAEEHARTVAALAIEVARDREAFRQIAEIEAPRRLQAGLERAMRACLDDLAEIRRERDGGFARLHLLDALRGRLRRGFSEVVETVRRELDVHLAGRVDAWFDRLRSVFGGDRPDGAQTARVAGLHGILDGYRLLLLEESFGRYQAYLEGWLDQAPLEVLLEEEIDASFGGQRSDPRAEELVDELRVRALRLDQARSPRLERLGDPVFDGVAQFVDEAVAEQRVLRVDLAKRVIEPLERLRA